MPPPGAHEHASHPPTGTCEHCGGPTLLERRYEVRDRLARALFTAICQTLDLEPRGTGRKGSPFIYVTAPDAATHERLWARYRELVLALDRQLIALTTGFIREHCGIVMPVQQRK